MGTPPCTPSAGPAPTRASTSTPTNLQTRQRLRTAPTPRNCPLPVTCIRPILWSRWPHQVPRPIISSTDGGPGSYRAVAAERPAARGVAPRGGASLGAVARQKTQCGTAGRSTLCVDLGAVSGARGRSLGEPSVAMMIPGMRRNGRGDPSRRPRREGTRQPAGRPAYNPTQQSTRDLSCSSTGTQVHGSRFEELAFTWLIIHHPPIDFEPTGGYPCSDKSSRYAAAGQQAARTAPLTARRRPEETVVTMP